VIVTIATASHFGALSIIPPHPQEKTFVISSLTFFGVGRHHRYFIEQLNTLVPPVLLYSSTEKKPACPGLGLLYSLLASVFFSTAALLVKKIEGMHAIQISAVRCFFQMLFVLPAMIYFKYESMIHYKNDSDIFQV